MDKSWDVPYGGVLGVLCLGNMVSARVWRHVRVVSAWPRCITTRDLSIVTLDT
jgi:hypothetical protein